jgi:predicted small metal-binding protein
MAKVYLISCRDAGIDCDFEARGTSSDEVMQLCADHAMRGHKMKAFGPDAGHAHRPWGGLGLMLSFPGREATPRG